VRNVPSFAQYLSIPSLFGLRSNRPLLEMVRACQQEDEVVVDKAWPSDHESACVVLNWLF
jgi:hypothetical protein